MIPMIEALSRLGITKFLPINVNSKSQYNLPLKPWVHDIMDVDKMANQSTSPANLKYERV